MDFLRNWIDVPTPGDALPDRDRPIPVTRTHLVLDTPMTRRFPTASSTSSSAWAASGARIGPSDWQVQARAVRRRAGHGTTSAAADDRYGQ